MYRVRACCGLCIVLSIALLMSGLGMVVPPSLQARQLHRTSGGPVNFDGWMAQAEQQRGAGDHAAAARSYTAAYQALPEPEQVGLKGEIAVDNALSDYRQAYEEQPEDLKLLEEEVALLERFVQRRAGAHEAGQAEVVPVKLEDELARLRALLDQRRAEVEASARAGIAESEGLEDEGLEDEGSEDEGSEDAGSQSEDSQSEGSEDEGAEDEGPQSDLLGAGVPDIPATEAKSSEIRRAKVDSAISSLQDDVRDKREADAAILIGGLASLAGGGVLVGVGAWNFEKIGAELQARTTAFGEGQFTEQARVDYELQLADWRRRWRGAAVGLVAAGSVLAAAGIGLITWGVVRMRRDGRESTWRASVGVPTISRRTLGAMVTIEF